MADIQSRDSLGKSSGKPGSSTQQQSGNDGGLSGQVKETIRNVSDRASDTWDDVSRRGADYYRQGSRAVGDVEPGTMTGMLIAGALGFGLGWLVFGQSRSGAYVANRMSASSERNY